jgi:hypothetical protein
MSFLVSPADEAPGGGPKPFGVRDAITGVKPMQYHIAFMLESSGDWEIMEEFNADSNAAANDYAEQEYSGKPWYVLNAAQENING